MEGKKKKMKAEPTVYIDADKVVDLCEMRENALERCDELTAKDRAACKIGVDNFVDGVISHVSEKAMPKKFDAEEEE